MNGKRAFEFLNKIGFERVSGSKEEAKAAQMICDEIESIGGKAVIEEFDVSSQDIKVAKLEVLKPEYKSYEVTGFGSAGSTPEEGITAGFYYYECDSIVDKENAKGKIVLINGRLSRQIYKSIIEAGALGFISFNGDLNDDNVDIAYNELRDSLKEFGIIPGVNLKVQDAVDLVLSEPQEVKLTLIQDEFQVKSRNVISEIEGTDKKDEVVVVTAHFDSVKYSTGVYDNGAGSVINLEAYRYFMENKPRRTLKFIWCGSEERGLLGSKAWVRDHNDELKNIKLCINCDVAGPVLGRDVIFVTGTNEILDYCKSFANEIGFTAVFHLDTYSSDSIPFADNGIPGINVTRFGLPGTAYIHNRYDIIKYLDYKNLEKTGSYQIKLMEKIDKAVNSPFEFKVSDEVKVKVDKYLFKDKK